MIQFVIELLLHAESIENKLQQMWKSNKHQTLNFEILAEKLIKLQ